MADPRQNHCFIKQRVLDTKSLKESGYYPYSLKDLCIQSRKTKERAYIL